MHITKSIKGKIIEIDGENNILIDFEDLPNIDQFNEIIDVSLNRFYSGLNWEEERFNDIKKFLEKISKKEKIRFETEALSLIAKKREGAVRDALSIF